MGKEECSGSLKNVLDALYVLNGKWKLALILFLVQSSKRFNGIQNEITLSYLPGQTPYRLSK